MIDKNLLPYDSANIFFIDNILDKNILLQSLAEIKKFPKNIFEAPINCIETIGSSIEFLHTKKYKNKKELNDNYIRDSLYFNSLTRPTFDFLYEHIREKITDILGIECRYRDDMLRPYIRSWRTNQLGLLKDNNMGFHYDCNVLFVDYETMFKIKPINIISATIMLELPDFSYFEYLPDTKTNDPNIYFDNKLNNSFHSKNIEERDLIPENYYSNKLCHKYKINDMVLQWNHMVHRVGKLQYSRFDQKRTTIQISGIHDGEVIWISS